MIGVLKKLKQIMATVGKGITKAANSKIVQSIVKPLSEGLKAVPVVGGVLSSAVKSLPNTASEYGKLITGMSEANNTKEFLKSWHDYNQNTGIIANPIKPFAVVGDALYNIWN